MPNTYFQFKQFLVEQEHTAMKVTTDGCLFGAWIADELARLNVNGTLLDIGTGTGLLSLMIAQKNPVNIQALELDNNAAKQAKFNIDNSPWKDRIAKAHADVRTWKYADEFDVIVSNPPFYEDALKSESAQRNAALHSSHLSLSGLLHIIIQQLKNTGTFFLLLPFKRNEEVDRLISQSGLFIHRKVFVHQSEKHGIFRVMVMGSKQPTQLQSAHMMIKYGTEYSQEFSRLLKDYYLKL